MRFFCYERKQTKYILVLLWKKVSFSTAGSRGAECNLSNDYLFNFILGLGKTLNLNQTLLVEPSNFQIGA